MTVGDRCGRAWGGYCQAAARHIAVGAIFAGVAVVATWPLAMHLGKALPQGREPVATVPFFNAWTIWWNCDRARRLYESYWDAPIFHPVENTFAFSEPMPLTVAAWPLGEVGNLATAYNVLLLAALTWNGFAGYQLARRLHVTWWIAIAGGVLIETLPFVFNELGVFQLVPVFGILYVLICLDAFAAAPSLGRAVLLGGSFALTYHLCTYYALFLAVAAPLPALALLGRSLLNWRTWTLLAFGGIVALAMILPTLHRQWRITREHDMRRDPALVQDLSARVADYAAAPWAPAFYPDPGKGGGRGHIRLSPGVIKYALAVFGVVAGTWRRPTRRWTIVLLLLTGSGFVLSLGLNLSMGGWRPYEHLMEWVPGLAQARNVFRFALFPQLGAVLLAVMGLSAIAQIGRGDNEPPAASRRWGPAIAAALLALMAITELWPPQQQLFAMPEYEYNSAWLTWLENETPPDSVIACLPFPGGKRVHDYQATAVWMYYQTFHRRRMVNGYSGFFPPSFLDLKTAMAGFPDDASLTALSASGAAVVLVARDENPFRAAAIAASLERRMTRVFADESARIDIYRFNPP